MPYGICSAPWPVRCTSRVLHVVLMIIYLLACYELLLFSLVGIVVWVCIQSIHRYLCKPIVGYVVFISGVNLDLLFLAVAICPTIGVGSFHLH